MGGSGGTCLTSLPPSPSLLPLPLTPPSCPLHFSMPAALPHLSLTHSFHTPVIVLRPPPAHVASIFLLKQMPTHQACCAIQNYDRRTAVSRHDATWPIGRQTQTRQTRHTTVNGEKMRKKRKRSSSSSCVCIISSSSLLYPPSTMQQHSILFLTACFLHFFCARAWGGMGETEQIQAQKPALWHACLQPFLWWRGVVFLTYLPKTGMKRKRENPLLSCYNFALLSVAWPVPAGTLAEEGWIPSASCWRWPLK